MKEVVLGGFRWFIFEVLVWYHIGNIQYTVGNRKLGLMRGREVESQSESPEEK